MRVDINFFLITIYFFNAKIKKLFSLLRKAQKEKDLYTFFEKKFIYYGSMSRNVPKKTFFALFKG